MHAFLFPGQGSQSVGMLSEYLSVSGQAASTFSEASEVLGYDLADRVLNGPEDELNRTECTQPALLTAGVALWRTWNDKGAPLPSMLAGHSLGEYTALVCGGALSFTDAVALVRERGRLMQDAVPPGEGAMAAILGLDDDVVISACNDAANGDVVAAVNFNSPGQVVIAGNTSAVERAIDRAKERGARRAISLPVSVPSHCALMRDAADKLAVVMQDIDFQLPTIPVLHNVNTTSSDTADAIRQALAEQLYEPVRWVECIQGLQAAGCTNMVECGPGKVLTGLLRRIDRELSGWATETPESMDKAIEGVS